MKKFEKSKKLIEDLKNRFLAQIKENLNLKEID